MKIPYIAYFILFLTSVFVFLFSIFALGIEYIKRKRNKKNINIELESLNEKELTEWYEERQKIREKSKTIIGEHAKAKIVEIEYHKDSAIKEIHPYNRNMIKFK